MLNSIGKLSGSPLIVRRSPARRSAASVVSGTPSLRSFLSGAGQTAYDAASADSFFAVSSTDWDAVITGLGNTSKIGPSDANFTGISGSAFSANFLFTMSQGLATVPANNYIIGFRASTINANTTWKLYGAGTFRSTNPVYSQISTTSPTTGSGVGGVGTFYYLRKAPPVQSATTYIAWLSTQNFDMTGNNTYLTPTDATSAAYSQSPFNSWLSWQSRVPKIQALITPTAVV